MTPSILVVGDSHVGIYHKSKLNNYFNILKIIHTDCEDVQRNEKFIPYLMNTISNKGEIYLSHHIEKYKNVDYIMYIFGEPDIRIHFDKQINLLNQDEDEVIETLCKNYITKLLEITPNNTKIIIRYILPQRIHSMFNTIYIPKGNINDRSRYTNKMNQKLKELSSLNNVLFLDNYEKNQLIENDGSLKDDFCDGITHYNENAINYINNELQVFLSVNTLTKDNSMPSVFFLGHNGLGDNITNIGAINYLLTIYKNVYFICKDIYIENLKEIYTDPRIYLVPFKSNNEPEARFKLLIPRYNQKNMDVLISGDCHKSNFKSKIQNNSIKYRNKNNEYSIDPKYIHIKNFYDDINLDLSIYYNYFNISSSAKSIELYENIKYYNIIFMHSIAGNNKKIDLTEYINKFIDNENDIIISADYNVYKKEDKKFELAQQYVNVLVPHYIDIIKNAKYIYIIDSCFSCIVIPLSYRNELKTIEYKIFDRKSST